MMTTRTFLLACLCLCLAACTPVRELAPFPFITLTPEPEVAEFDAAIQAALSEAHIAGATLGIQSGNDPAFIRSYGFSDAAAATSTNPDTIYQIGSITKQMTAAAVLKLAEQGKLNLEDQIGMYIPEITPKAAGIPICTLLNHTSGLPPFGAILIPVDPEKDYTTAEVIALLNDNLVSLEAAPGATWAYNNLGYYLLGIVIERVSGIRYADYLHKEIFTPIGLKNTAYCPDPQPGLAAGYLYSYSDSKYIPAETNMSLVLSAGGICSTARDLLEWRRALTGGLVISQASYQEMITPGSTNAGEALNYGYGWMMYGVEPDRVLYHPGRMDGFQSYLYYEPDRDLTIVLLANTGGDAAGEIILNTVLPIFNSTNLPN